MNNFVCTYLNLTEITAQFLFKIYTDELGLAIWIILLNN